MLYIFYLKKNMLFIYSSLWGLIVVPLRFLRWWSCFLKRTPVHSMNIFTFYPDCLYLHSSIHPFIHLSIHVHNILGVMVVCSYWLTCTHIDSSAEYLTNYKWFLENISLWTDFHYTYVLKSVFRCILTQNSNNELYFPSGYWNDANQDYSLFSYQCLFHHFFFLSLTYDLMAIESPFF